MARQRVPRTRGNQRYTESQFWGFIRAGLRSKYQRWGPRYDTIADAKRKMKVKKGNQIWEYQCCKCKKWFAQKEVEVDHINPCGSLRSFSDLPGFVERLFCEKEGLRLLCKPCHKKITQEAKK